VGRFRPLVVANPERDETARFNPRLRVPRRRACASLVQTCGPQPAVALRPPVVPGGTQVGQHGRQRQPCRAVWICTTEESRRRDACEHGNGAHPVEFSRRSSRGPRVSDVGLQLGDEVTRSCDVRAWRRNGHTRSSTIPREVGLGPGIGMARRIAYGPRWSAPLIGHGFLFCFFRCHSSAASAPAPIRRSALAKDHMDVVRSTPVGFRGATVQAFPVNRSDLGRHRPRSMAAMPTRAPRTAVATLSVMDALAVPGLRRGGWAQPTALAPTTDPRLSAVSVIMMSRAGSRSGARRRSSRLEQ